MPYNPEKEIFEQSKSTIVDSTPDGDSVRQGFDDRLTPAMAGVYNDLNLLKVNGMIGVGIPATEAARGIGRVATAAEVAARKTGANGPAWVTPENVPVVEVPEIVGYISEFRDFFEQTPPAGWAVRNGAVLANADTGYPDLWKYLQLAANKWKCKTLAEWNALSKTAGGVGGVPFFVVDTTAKTIKLPDTRGDYTREAGSSFLQAVGAWHEDGVNAHQHGAAWYSSPTYAGGGNPCLGYEKTRPPAGNYTTVGGEAGNFTAYLMFTSQPTPMAVDNRTRTYATLGCVYVRRT